jgi:hypothetical protein
MLPPRESPAETAEKVVTPGGATTRLVNVTGGATDENVVSAALGAINLPSPGEMEDAVNTATGDIMSRSRLGATVEAVKIPGGDVSRIDFVSTGATELPEKVAGGATTVFDMAMDTVGATDDAEKVPGGVMTPPPNPGATELAVKTAGGATTVASLAITGATELPVNVAGGATIVFETTLSG